MPSWKVVNADCVEAMAAMDEASVDAIVTDPPYELDFMGKHWDRSGVAFQAGTWAEALRVLKPGGHLLAFGGTRTFHRLTCALEDAGFEIRDCLSWLYGSGFPKSLDVSKAIDKAAGAERELRPVIVPQTEQRTYNQGKRNVQCADCGKWSFSPDPCRCPRDNGPQTPDAQRWQGWGTALKPAWEPVVLARKPLVGTVAANVLEHGTGAINVDGCRVETDDELSNHGRKPTENGWDPRLSGGQEQGQTPGQTLGRWPANVVLDETAAALLDEQSGERPAGVAVTRNIAGRSSGLHEGGWTRPASDFQGSSDTGGASRFFYTAKAGREERNNGKRSAVDAAANLHPTVKPVSLMQWLVRMVTPPGGTVLDPFTGSGSTGIAALREGFGFIGIEREAEYVEIARDRIIGDAPMFNVGAEVAEP